MKVTSTARNSLPDNPLIRVIVGMLLVIGGIFGFLPVLGFWMIPLGLIILSIDLPPVRRFRRKMEVRWGRYRQRRQRSRRRPGEPQ